MMEVKSAAWIIFLLLKINDVTASSYNCTNLALVPSPYAYNGSDLTIAAASCLVHARSNLTIDMFELMSSVNISTSSEELQQADIFINCTQPANLSFNATHDKNMNILLSLRLQDCIVPWQELDRLGHSLTIIEVSPTYIKIPPLFTDNSSIGNLSGIANLLHYTLTINTIAPKIGNLSIDQVVAVIPSLAELSIICIDSYTMDPHGCVDTLYSNVKYSIPWLRSNYNHLQSLVVYGFRPDSIHDTLKFPWNNQTRLLPFNLTYSANQQQLFAAETGTDLRRSRRILRIRDSSINPSQICPLGGPLDTADLTETYAKSFPFDCFYKSNSLTTIDIGDNAYLNLSSDTFKGLSRLKRLDLRANQLTRLPDGLFDDLENLVTLNLDYNHLIYIQAGIFNKLVSLQSIFLHQNRIRVVEPYSFPVFSPHLRFIDLRFNNLTELVTDCLRFPNLKICDLGSNIIKVNNWQSVVAEEFDPVRLLMVEPQAYYGQPLSRFNEGPVHETDSTRLGLTNNIQVRINFQDGWTSFQKMQLAAFLSFYKLDLTHNIMDCDCALFMLKRWIHEEQYRSTTIFLAKYSMVLLLSRSDFDSWQCKVNPLLADVDLPISRFLQVPNDRFICPFYSTECPKQCVCNRLLGEMENYLIDCYNKSLSELPETVPVPHRGENMTVSLAYNNITRLPPRSDISSGKYLWLGYVTKLDLQSNPLGSYHSLDSFRDFLASLESITELNLRSTNLISLPRSIMSIDFQKLTITDNSLTCCNANWMKPWLRENRRQIVDSSKIRCTVSDLPIVEMNDSDFTCPHFPSYVFLLLLLFLIPCIIIPATAYRHRDELKILLFERFGWRVALFTQHPDEEQKKYHAVLIYASSDYEWAQQTLLPHLEEKYRYEIFVPFRDIDYGDLETERVTEALCNSNRAIMVMSNSFIADDKCMKRFCEARAFQNEKRFVLMITVEELQLNPEECRTHTIIQNFLTTNFYVDIKHTSRCLARLCWWMPTRKPKSLPKLSENLRMSSVNNNTYGSINYGSDADSVNQPLIT